MASLSSIILPVLEGMEESHLKVQLLKFLPNQEEAFSKIEKSFNQLTSKVQDKERLQRFFHSWSQTNNSAMTVSGISNRMTMLVHKNQPIADEKALLQSITSLNRIVDEDLAVVGRILHSQLFYTMATTICTDDDWLSRRYLNQSACDFKAWKDQNSLRNKDIMIALLTTLIHEIYTHGEVELILPKFQSWLINDYGYTEEECDKTLAWISVHCGPTEKNHFFFAVSSIFHYAKAMNIDLESYDLETIVNDYLAKKSAVMVDLLEVEELSF
ncbi:hypothetical protein [Flavobacterium tructae]|uniref:Uncharacterized protein n=1 Tax=Flavobacterium tructae TaxID=1114873 RepID=A0A1S1J2A5_9FLAO|nr:hypothetical protein [Flavobacterium tructae]OHT44732.1 hypothetical protein BHE19_13565 [Flavobacterium tructae]OXB19129.1 hypothetical protein B0A71_11300 [Flavobacterium tructae]